MVVEQVGLICLFIPDFDSSEFRLIVLSVSIFKPRKQVAGLADSWPFMFQVGWQVA